MRKRTLILFYCLAFLLCGGVIAVFWPQKAHTPSQGYCAFCDPKVREAQKIYEDDLVLALYTHKPIFAGHCLIIPKRHVERFEDLSSSEASQITQVIKKVHHAVQTTFETSPYLLLQKNGREVGQTVPHVHFHYIPRKIGDTSILKLIFKMYLVNGQKPISPSEMQEICTKLKASMNK